RRSRPRIRLHAKYRPILARNFALARSAFASYEEEACFLRMIPPARYPKALENVAQRSFRIRSKQSMRRRLIPLHSAPDCHVLHHDWKMAVPGSVRAASDIAVRAVGRRRSNVA